MSSGITTKIFQPVHKIGTTEKVIGEWITGKPVYEKVIQKTITTNDNAAHEIVLMSLSGITLISSEGVIFPATNTLKSHLPIPSIVSNTNYVCIASRGGVTGNLILMYYNPNFKGSTANIIVRYFYN